MAKIIHVGKLVMMMVNYIKGAITGTQRVNYESQGRPSTI